LAHEREGWVARWVDQVRGAQVDDLERAREVDAEAAQGVGG
jgi:hypothetical protein